MGVMLCEGRDGSWAPSRHSVSICQLHTEENSQLMSRLEPQISHVKRPLEICTDFGHHNDRQFLTSWSNLEELSLLIIEPDPSLSLLGFSKRKQGEEE